MAQPFSLSLVEGELLIDDAEEAYPLEQPTTIGGMHDTGDGGTGTVTNGSFASPAIAFKTTASGANVDVLASFGQVTPNSGTGTIDADGAVSFRTELWVDLNLVINGSWEQDCRVGPVVIGLDSTAPWDPDTGQVTVRDPDFTIPPTVEQPTCDGLIVLPLNNLLSGSGHALTMTLQGDLELPPPVGCPTATELSVSPDGSSLGQPVTFDATVVAAPDGRPECDGIEAGDVPPGSVEFLAGSTQLGVVELNEFGQAQLVSSAMVTGTHDLIARYRPVPPFSTSRSTAVPFTVVAPPTVSIDAPSGFTIGAAPVELRVEVTNPALGREVENGRLDATIVWAQNPGLTFERWDGASWVPVDLEPAPVSPPTSYGIAMPAGGVALEAGESLTQRYRLSGTGTPTPLTIKFELVPVDPDDAPPPAAAAPTDTALARASVDTVFTTSPRRDLDFTLSVNPHTSR